MLIVPESVGLLFTPNVMHPEQVQSSVEAVGTLIVPSDFVPLPENDDDAAGAGAGLGAEAGLGAGAVVVAVTVFAGRVLRASVTRAASVGLQLLFRKAWTDLSSWRMLVALNP